MKQGRLAGPLPGPGPPRACLIEQSNRRQTKRIKAMNQSNSIDPNTLKQLKQAMQKRQQEQQATSENRPQQPRSQPENEEPRVRPAKSIPQGDVITRIWANPNVLGDFEWSIDQRRKTATGVLCKSLRPEHVEDAIRGLYLSLKWIKKTERRLFWRRLLP